MEVEVEAELTGGGGGGVREERFVLVVGRTEADLVDVVD